ncbi:MAG: hypothetical protein QXN39_02380, partial [Archaeoglobaceae archaeon]
IPFIRPESIVLSDFETRDYWILETAKATLKRIELMNSDNELAKLAKEKYNTNPEEYREMVIMALQKLREETEITEESEDFDLDSSIEEEIMGLDDIY